MLPPKTNGPLTGPKRGPSLHVARTVVPILPVPLNIVCDEHHEAEKPI
jgi:hypothetical protein